jgi:hypothetical protein
MKITRQNTDEVDTTKLTTKEVTIDGNEYTIKKLAITDAIELNSMCTGKKEEEFFFALVHMAVIDPDDLKPLWSIERVKKFELQFFNQLSIEVQKHVGVMKDQIEQKRDDLKN